jgi:integrase
VITVSVVHTTNAAEQSPTTQPAKGARRQANRHLDRLLSPGKDPTGRTWLAPAEVPAEVGARVAALVGAYRQHQLGRPDVANRVCQNSVDSEVVKLAQFLLYAGVREPGTGPADYTIELIHRYRGELSDLGASVNTTNAALAALRKFFDHILAPAAVNPARAITFAKTTQKGGRRALYTRGQCDAILAAAAAATTGVRPRCGRPLKHYLGAWADYAVTALWAYTGAESGALLRAHVGDLDVAGRAITWRDSHDRPTYSQPLPDQLVAILAGYLAAARPTAGPGGPLVTNPRARAGAGGPMSDQGLLQLARRVAVAAGVGTGDGRGQGHTPRRWRDTYVSRVTRAPHGSLLTVKVLLGLQELASTGTYASLGVANKSVSVNDAHAGLVAPAGLATQRWPHAQLSLAAAPAARAGKGSWPRRRARVQVRDLAATGINPADAATLLACELSFPGHLGGQGKGRETRAAYQLEALYLRAWLTSNAPEVTHPRRATGGQLLAYLEHLAAAGSSVATRRRTTSALRAFYRYLAIKHPGMVNPTDVLPSLAEVVTEADTHTEADVVAVLARAWAAATDAHQRGDFTAWLLARRDHALLATLAFGAARRNETRALATFDVDADARLLTLHGKGQASRTITIPGVLADILSAYLRDVRPHPHFPDNPYLFTDLVPAGADTDEHGNAWPRLGKEVIYRICYHYGTLAGVAGPCHPHSYRHSAASRMHAAGMSISDISAYLGHASPLITLRYIHIPTGFLRAVLAEAFPPAANSLSILPGLCPAADGPNPSHGDLLSAEAR